MRERVQAGVLLAGLVFAVIIIVHVIGSPTTPPASPSASLPATTSTTTTTQHTTTGQPTSTLGTNGYPLPVVETAQALGISPATLQADIQDGETVPQIAQAQHVPIATVNAAYLRGVQEQGAQGVQKGIVDQATANQNYQQAEQRVQNGQYGLLTGYYTNQPAP